MNRYQPEFGALEARSATKILPVLVSLGLASLAGCTPPVQNPALSSDFSVGAVPYHYVATTSDRRLIVFDGKNVCMEPPPDTTENVTSQLTGAVSASGSAGAGPSAAISANAAAAIGNALGNVNPTSQGIYWFRTVAANYCIAYMNNALKAQDYVTQLSSAAAAALLTVNQELVLTNGKVGADIKPLTQPVANGNAPTVPPVPAPAAPAVPGSVSPVAPAPPTAPVSSTDKAKLLSAGQTQLSTHLNKLTQ
ncbi:MAG TPA: hypothetical protein VFL55_01500 [Acetobacteraceae bacterium]|nr:hypothetical protein [Acetobacteraceae bacterium]